MWPFCLFVRMTKGSLSLADKTELRSKLTSTHSYVTIPYPSLVDMVILCNEVRNYLKGDVLPQATSEALDSTGPLSMTKGSFISRAVPVPQLVTGGLKRDRRSHCFPWDDFQRGSKISSHSTRDNKGQRNDNLREESLWELWWHLPQESTH